MPIHNHITPQEYLKHFATSKCPDRIWRYDKRKAFPELLPIIATGQRKDFYPSVEESRLSKIEQSALVPFNQLRGHLPISESGRVAAAHYLATMIARTERVRLKMAKYLSEDIANAKNAPELSAAKWNVPVAPMLEHFGELEEQLSYDPLRTKDTILHQVLEFPDVQDLIAEMNWQVLTANASEGFLTSDTPVFVGRAKGLKPPNGTFLFPLASWIALVGSWQTPQRSLAYLSADSRFIREFNRYVSSGADRWLYYRERADWVIKVMKNPSIRVGREPW